MIRFHGSQTLSFIPDAIYNRVKRFGFDVRSSPLQSAPMDFFCPETVVILHREQTRPGSRNGGFSELRSEILRRGFFASLEASELYLCMPKSFSAYKGARSARLGGVPESRHLNYQTDDNHEKENRTPDNDRSQSPQV